MTSRRRQRNVRACKRCRDLHCRCDGVEGVVNCSECRKHDAICVFTPGGRRGPKRPELLIRFSDPTTTLQPSEVSSGLFSDSSASSFSRHTPGLPFIVDDSDGEEGDGEFVPDAPQQLPTSRASRQLLEGSTRPAAAAAIARRPPKTKRVSKRPKPSSLRHIARVPVGSNLPPVHPPAPRTSSSSRRTQPPQPPLRRRVSHPTGYQQRVLNPFEIEVRRLTEFYRGGRHHTYLLPLQVVERLIHLVHFRDSDDIRPHHRTFYHSLTALLLACERSFVEPSAHSSFRLSLSFSFVGDSASRESLAMRGLSFVARYFRIPFRDPTRSASPSDPSSSSAPTYSSAGFEPHDDDSSLVRHCHGRLEEVYAFLCLSHFCRLLGKFRLALSYSLCAVASCRAYHVRYHSVMTPEQNARQHMHFLNCVYCALQHFTDDIMVGIMLKVLALRNPAVVSTTVRRGEIEHVLAIACDQATLYGWKSFNVSMGCFTNVFGVASPTVLFFLFSRIYVSSFAGVLMEGNQSYESSIDTLVEVCQFRFVGGPLMLLLRSCLISQLLHRCGLLPEALTWARVARRASVGLSNLSLDFAPVTIILYYLVTFFATSGENDACVEILQILRRLAKRSLGAAWCLGCVIHYLRPRHPHLAMLEGFRDRPVDDRATRVVTSLHENVLDGRANDEFEDAESESSEGGDEGNLGPLLSYFVTMRTKPMMVPNESME